jgi:hypothetical protein
VKKKKILFISTKNPFSDNFSGDRLVSSKIITFLKKQKKVSKIDIVCTEHKKFLKKNLSKNNLKIFSFPNFALRLLNIFISFIKMQPIQLGIFFSSEMKEFIKNNHSKYDVIICHLIRSAQYLPTDFKGEKILEMTDAFSANYKQTIKNMSIFNPLIFVYFLERILVKKYEKLCIDLFDKIILISKKELLDSMGIRNHKKIFEIKIGIDKNKNIFKFKNNNFKIIFIGNIKYLPNKYACYSFVKNTMPKLRRIYPDLEFHIIGEISSCDRFFLSCYKNIKVLGKIKKLSKIINGSICGLANLDIATGMQTKILTYVSFGLPAVCSEKSLVGFGGKNKNKNLLCYSNEKEMIGIITRLKEDKKFSLKESKKSQVLLSKYDWKRSLSLYNKII